jgi:putative endonuclease
MSSFVYILTNNFNTTLYIGVTNNIYRRIYEHKNEFNQESFTSKYNLKKLIYVEEFSNISDAITREKQLKNWHRKWKIELIESVNPSFKELFE